jgi:Lipase (class 3)
MARPDKEKLELKLKALMSTARGLASQIDWKDLSFDADKAHCLALFSEISYYCVTPLERRYASRVKVIPCYAHHQIALLGSRFRFESIVRSEEDIEVIIFQTEYFVAVSFILNKVTVVAVRGTKSLYDWWINLSVARKADRSDDESPKLHVGFAREARLLLYHLKHILLPNAEKRYAQYRNNQRPKPDLYFAGHSLGGAIAAIAFSRWNSVHGPFGGGTFDEVGSYTFAMPRLASLDDLLEMENPYTLTNEDDIVPRLPPRILGYHNALLEFDLNCEPHLGNETQVRFPFLRWLSVIASGQLLPNHAMETYRRRIRAGQRP